MKDKLVSGVVTFSFISIVLVVLILVFPGPMFWYDSPEAKWIIVRAGIVGIIGAIMRGIISLFKGSRRTRVAGDGILLVALYACTAFIVAGVIATIIFFGNYECREVDRTEQPVSNVAIYDEIIECDNLCIPRKGTKIIYASEETIVKIEQYTEVKSIFGEEISRKTNRVLHFPTTETQKT